MPPPRPPPNPPRPPPPAVHYDPSDLDAVGFRNALFPLVAAGLFLWAHPASPARACALAWGALLAQFVLQVAAGIPDRG